MWVYDGGPFFFCICVPVEKEKVLHVCGFALCTVGWILGILCFLCFLLSAELFFLWLPRGLHVCGLHVYGRLNFGVFMFFVLGRTFFVVVVTKRLTCGCTVSRPAEHRVFCFGNKVNTTCELRFKITFVDAKIQQAGRWARWGQRYPKRQAWNFCHKSFCHNERKTKALFTRIPLQLCKAVDT